MLIGRLFFLNFYPAICEAVCLSSLLLMCADGCRGLCDGIPLLLIRLCTKVFLPRTDPYSSESSVSFHSSFCENSVRSARTRASDTMLKRVILCSTYSLVSAFIKFLDWFHHLFLSVFIFDPLAGSAPRSHSGNVRTLQHPWQCTDSYLKKFASLTV